MTTQAHAETARRWQALSLRAAGVSLIDCEHRTPPAANEGYPYVAIPQIKNGHLDLTDARRISSKHFAEWTRKARPQAYDVILSRRCNPGETALVPPGLECALGQNLVLLRADGTKVLPAFLRWLVRGPEWWEQIGTFLNVGAIFDSLKCADVPNFTLTIPSIDEQQRIADILGSLDNKIELNRRMNETLEAMGWALFKSWFIDFDPVHSKATIRRAHPKWTNAQVSRAALPNLASNIAELFPDSFEDSSLGPIPAGWKIAKIEEVSTINEWTLGKRDPLSAIDYVEISEVMRGQIGVVPRYQRGEEPSRARRRLRHGDVVLSTVRPDRGAYFTCLHPPESLIASTGFAVITAKTVPWSWMACALTRDEIFEYLGHHADGGAYPAVNSALIGAIQYAVPTTPGVLDAFDATCSSWLLRAHENRDQMRQLAAMRDSMLPKLLSGTLTVSSQ